MCEWISEKTLYMFNEIKKSTTKKLNIICVVLYFTFYFAHIIK